MFHVPAWLGCRKKNFIDGNSAFFAILAPVYQNVQNCVLECSVFVQRLRIKYNNRQQFKCLFVFVSNALPTFVCKTIAG